MGPNELFEMGSAEESALSSADAYPSAPMSAPELFNGLSVVGPSITAISGGDFKDNILFPQASLISAGDIYGLHLNLFIRDAADAASFKAISERLAKEHALLFQKAFRRRCLSPGLSKGESGTPDLVFLLYLALWPNKTIRAQEIISIKRAIKSQITTSDIKNSHENVRLPPYLREGVKQNIQYIDKKSVFISVLEILSHVVGLNEHPILSYHDFNKNTIISVSLKLLNKFYHRHPDIIKQYKMTLFHLMITLANVCSDAAHVSMLDKLLESLTNNSIFNSEINAYYGSNKIRQPQSLFSHHMKAKACRLIGSYKESCRFYRMAMNKIKAINSFEILSIYMDYFDIQWQFGGEQEVIDIVKGLLASKAMVVEPYRSIISAYLMLSDDYPVSEYDIKFQFESLRKFIPGDDVINKGYYYSIGFRFIEKCIIKYDFSRGSIAFFMGFIKKYVSFIINNHDENQQMYNEIKYSRCALLLFDNSYHQLIKITKEFNKVKKFNFSIKFNGFYNIGKAFLKIGRFNEALDCLNKAHGYINELSCHNKVKKIQQVEAFIIECNLYLGKIVEVKKSLMKEENHSFVFLMQKFNYYMEENLLDEAANALVAMPDLLKSSGNYRGAEEALINIRLEQITYIRNKCSFYPKKIKKFTSLFDQHPLYTKHINDAFCMQIEIHWMINESEQAKQLLMVNDIIPEYFKKSIYFIKNLFFVAIINAFYKNIPKAKEGLSELKRLITEYELKDTLWNVYEKCADAMVTYHEMLEKRQTNVNKKIIACKTLMDECVHWFDEHPSHKYTMIRTYCESVLAHIARAEGNPDLCASLLTQSIEQAAEASLPAAMTEEATLALSELGLSPIASAYANTSAQDLSLLLSPRPTTKLTLVSQLQHDKLWGLQSVQTVIRSVSELKQDHMFYHIDDKLRASIHKRITFLEEKIMPVNQVLTKIKMVSGHVEEYVDMKTIINNEKSYIAAWYNELIGSYILCGNYDIALRCISFYVLFIKHVFKVHNDIKLLLNYSPFINELNKSIKLLKIDVTRMSSSSKVSYLDDYVYIVFHRSAVASYIYAEKLTQLNAGENTSKRRVAAIQQLESLADVSYSALASLILILYHEKQYKKIIELFKKLIVKPEFDNKLISVNVDLSNNEKIILPKSLLKIIDKKEQIHADPIMLILYMVGKTLREGHEKASSALHEELNNKMINRATACHDQLSWHLLLSHMTHDDKSNYSSYMSFLTDPDLKELFDKYKTHQVLSRRRSMDEGITADEPSDSSDSLNDEEEEIADSLSDSQDNGLEENIDIISEYQRTHHDDVKLLIGHLFNVFSSCLNNSIKNHLLYYNRNKLNVTFDDDALLIKSNIDGITPSVRRDTVLNIIKKLHEDFVFLNACITLSSKHPYHTLIIDCSASHMRYAAIKNAINNVFHGPRESTEMQYYSDSLAVSTKFLRNALHSYDDALAREFEIWLAHSSTATCQDRENAVGTAGYSSELNATRPGATIAVGDQSCGEDANWVLFTKLIELAPHIVASVKSSTEQLFPVSDDELSGSTLLSYSTGFSPSPSLFSPSRCGIYAQSCSDLTDVAALGAKQMVLN